MGIKTFLFAYLYIYLSVYVIMVLYRSCRSFLYMSLPQETTKFKDKERQKEFIRFKDDIRDFMRVGEYVPIVLVLFIDCFIFPAVKSFFWGFYLFAIPFKLFAHKFLIEPTEEEVEKEKEKKAVSRFKFRSIFGKT